MKPKVSILDNQFSHTHPGSFGCGDLKIPPTHFEWDRTGKEINNLIIITENSFWTVDSIKCKTKVGLILEPESISPDPYKWIKQPINYEKFSYILTHNKELLLLDDRFKWYPFGGCWLTKEQQQIYPKTKNISIIASWKNQTEGHKLRHEVIKRFGDRIDVFGNGYTKINSKLSALKDYKYTIVIENERRNGFFTEKLIDALRTGTVPIYWGAYDINHYFSNGILRASDISDIEHYIDMSDTWYKPEERKEDKEMIENNFEIAAQYCIPEDWLWENFFNPLNLVS